MKTRTSLAINKHQSQKESLVEKIWIKHYPDGVPDEINPDVYPSLVELLEFCFKEYGHKPAYQNMKTSLSFKEVDERSKHFASYLQNDIGLQQGDRVALMMPNVLQYPIALFGILRAGMVAVNTNPLYTAEEVIHQLNDSGAKAIVVLANFAHTIQQAQPQLQTIQKVITTELGDMFPWFKRTLVNLVVKYIKKMVPSYQLNHEITFRETLKLGAGHSYSRPTLDGQDIAFLQYTGGTTGVAKGAVLTHRNMVANVEQASHWIAPAFEVGSKQLIVTALPLYHIFSLTANCLTFLKYGARNMLITNPRDIGGFIKEIKNSQFTAITGVNTLFNALLNHPEFKNVDFSKLHYTLSGGMSLQESVANRWQAVTKRPILEAYGLTETSPAVTMNPHYVEGYNGSIGLPVPSTEVSIWDDAGQPVPIGEAGELCVRGPQVMRGYWQRPIETANVLDEDGWLKTGDVAKLDDKGFVYIVDRKKDMIIVSGFNVYPNEIEAVISELEGVNEVGVVGIPHAESGERVKACIVKSDPTLTEEQIIAHCRQHLTGYKIPKLIEFVEDLPKTNVGKILRRALRDKQVLKETA